MCESSPCLNGGVCRSYRKNYLCVCKDGFFGDQCQMCKWLCTALRVISINSWVRNMIHEPYSCICLSLSPPSGGPVYTETLWKSGEMLEWPERKLQLHLSNRTYRQRLWERSVQNHTRHQSYFSTLCSLFSVLLRHLVWLFLLFPDLLPPSGLHVVHVEENEVELRWDEPEPSHSQISGFAVTYAPLGWSNYKTDYLDRKQLIHVMRGLMPGLLYNISTVSIKHNTNSTDYSQPATALIRTSEYTFNLKQRLLCVNVSLKACFLCRTSAGGGAAGGQCVVITGLAELADSGSSPHSCQRGAGVFIAFRW